VICIKRRSEMIYQNSAWRKETGMTLDPLGQLLEPIAKGEKMTKKIKLKIDLDGPDGNAFAIMGKCKRAGFDNGWNVQKIDDFLAECQSGDYNNLLSVVRKKFDID